MAREIRGVGADPASDLQHLLATPALEFGKLRNMRFDEILARLDFVEVGARSHRLG